MKAPSLLWSGGSSVSWVCAALILSGSGTVLAQVGPVSAERAAEIRTTLIRAMDTYEIIAGARRLKDAAAAAADARDLIGSLADEELAPFADATAELEGFRHAVNRLAAIVLSRPPTPSDRPSPQATGHSAARIHGEAAPGSVSGASTVRRGKGDRRIRPRTPGFPSASYSGLCGSDRNDTGGVFAAQVALQAAELVWSAASRACDQVAVAAGVGGNTSLACVAADAVLFAAKAVLDDFKFCDADIDSAEIEGGYERLGHLHGDVEVVSGKIDLLDGKIEALRERVDEIWEREIEENLAHRHHLVSLMLPAAHGGRLETVRDIVQKWIDFSAATGMQVASAQALLDAGVQHMADGEYRCAFQDFAKAYHHLVDDHDRDDHDRHDDHDDDHCDDDDHDDDDD